MIRGIMPHGNIDDVIYKFNGVIYSWEIQFRNFIIIKFLFSCLYLGVNTMF